MECSDSDEVRYYMKRQPVLEVLEKLTAFMKLIQFLFYIVRHHELEKCSGRIAYTPFFISNAFFRPRLKCCLVKFKLPKNCLTLPENTIWEESNQREQKVSEFSSQYIPRLVLKIGKFQPNVAYKSVAYKIKSV